MQKLIGVLLLGVLVGSVPTAFALSSLLFSDIPSPSWYTQAVQNLAEKGIVQGYDDGTFRPENTVNRAEMAVMMDRLLTYLETDGSPSANDAELLRVGPYMLASNSPFSFGGILNSFPVFVDDDTLYVSVSYGGGCADHTFSLFWDGTFEADRNTYASFDLFHEIEGGQDSCEAAISPTLKFDISPLRQAFEEEYGEEHGSIFVNLRGSSPEPVLFEYYL